MRYFALQQTLFGCLLFLAFALSSFGQPTPFEKSNGTATATYPEIVNWYRLMDQQSDRVQVKEMGSTDAGYPLQLVLISNDGHFEPAQWQAQNKVILMINNGIHPGEPDGIDASMMFVRDIINGKIRLPKQVVIACIPVYNIGGCLNRNSHSRVNQNGPVDYGFRGNSQNLDLNRDFTKCDSKEAKTFASVFHWLAPDILMDNHVSDGADYQHTMTLITTQYQKLGKELGDWVKQTFEPAIYRSMKNKQWDMIPYVDFESTDIQKGMTMFYDPPRYSSGYAALFNTIAFVPETHMLKPFAQRVQATYDLMCSVLYEADEHAKSIRQYRKAAIEATQQQTSFPLQWVVNPASFDSIVFKGYEKDTTLSKATGLLKMFFNHAKPFKAKIPYFNQFQPEGAVEKPKAYVIPQGWSEVIERLKLNRIQVHRLQKDSSFMVTTYRIESYKSLPKAYEKHHKNTGVVVSTSKEERTFLRGDYVVYLNQPGNRYIVEMLEPTGDDSFFAWNFFDGILQQKEGYSDYRWEDLAAELLSKDSVLQVKLAEKKASDPLFAQNGPAILDFIYKNSIYYEKSHMRYPISRIE